MSHKSGFTISKVASSFPFCSHLQGQLHVGVGMLIVPLEPVDATVAL